MPLASGPGRYGYTHNFKLLGMHSKAVRQALKTEYPYLKIKVKIEDKNTMFAYLLSGNVAYPNEESYESLKESIEDTMLSALKGIEDTEDEKIYVHCYLGEPYKQEYIYKEPRLAESSAMTYNAEMDANVLFRQLGGNRFRAMTGAKDFMKDGNSLRMKIMKNNTGGNHLIITLNSNDLYDMRFESHRLNRKTYELTIKVKAEETNIPASNLQRVFTELSGLYTRMAEQSFNADDLTFKEWADQEMKTHGKKESFDDWLDDELKSHGDNVSLQKWGHHELDSHYERYGAEDYEVIYRVKAKYSPDENWEIIGDFDKKEDGERVFNKFIGSTYELRLIEIETMYEDDAPMEEADRLIMNYSSYGENGIQTFNAEIDGEELIASSANFSDGSMIVGVGTETLDVDNPDFMEMMIDKEGKIEYFTLPIGKGGWDRHYNIKPSHYGKMKTQNETNETAGGDFIRTDGEGKYAESFNADTKEKRNWVGFCPECQKWRDYEKGRTYKGYPVQPLSYFDEELGVWVCNKQHSYYRHESAYENAGYYKMPCGEPLRKSKNANAPKVGKDKKAVGASAYINQSQKEMIKTIKMCMKYANNNPWKDGKTTEKTFLEDMLERLKKGRDLTEGQANVTNRITGNIIRKNDLYWEAESFNAYQVDLPECCKDTEWIWRQAGLEEDKMVQLWKLQKPVIAKLRKSLKIPADVCLFPFWKDYTSEDWQLAFPYHAIDEESTELKDMDGVSVGKVSKGLIGELRKVAIPDDREPHSLDQLLSSRKAENFNSETKSLPYKWIAGAIALGISLPYISSLLNSGREK